MTPLELRHVLHRHPELSGAEHGTAHHIAAFFAPLRPDLSLTELGGAGLAFAFGEATHGPTVLLRCELDAVPAGAQGAAAHRCGHDGHMAILAAVGSALADQRPRRGRVVLLYQGAEETGAGAAAVLADPRFAQISPDWVFALHNLPGYPLGTIVVRPGAFTCASRGMVLALTGKAAHAAQPETGRSPAGAMCRLIGEFEKLAARFGSDDEIAFATVVGARLGERAFGTAPGDAQVYVTLRSATDATMTRMVRHCEEMVARVARDAGLTPTIGYEDVFEATTNAPAAVACIRRAADSLPVVGAAEPFRWSEDFGRFTARTSGALFGLGAGEHAAALHDPAYAFPDELLDPAARLLLRIVADSVARG